MEHAKRSDLASVDEVATGGHLHRLDQRKGRYGVAGADGDAESFALIVCANEFPRRDVFRFTPRRLKTIPQLRFRDDGFNSHRRAVSIARCGRVASRGLRWQAIR